MANTAVKVTELEARALSLPEEARAQLVGVLVRSFSESRRVSDLWLDQAESRDREMGEDPKAGSSAEKVFRKAYSSLE